MSKRSETPVEKVTLNLFEGDAERLRELFPQGASFIARNLIRQYIRRIEEEAAQRTTPVNIIVDLKEME